MLTNGNYFFTAIFAAESFIKLASMSPRYFFAVRPGHFFPRANNTKWDPTVVDHYDKVVDA
jgi:hypothetical protein